MKSGLLGGNVQVPAVQGDPDPRSVRDLGPGGVERSGVESDDACSQGK